MKNNSDEFEKTLYINIGLMARNLQKSGIILHDLDKLGEEALRFIHEKAVDVTTNQPLEAGNVENVIIMLLMHGIITSQKEFINSMAKRNGVSREKIVELMVKDTIEGKHDLI